MQYAKTLSRVEMKEIKAGTTYYMECDGCQNDTCRGYVDDCSSSTFAEMCGPARVDLDGNSIDEPSGYCRES